MAAAVYKLTGIPVERLFEEFKAMHQRYGNSEQPFAVLELPSVVEHFRTSDRAELRRHLDPALHAFNKTRKERLALYPTVRDTLERLHTSNCKIIGHTEAMLLNSYWRLSFFNIDRYLTRLYTLEGKWEPHPSPESRRVSDPRSDFVRIVPQIERKPNPRLLLDICEREGFHPSEVVYVGDSLTRDISMAKSAGVTAVWAHYGTVYDKAHWEILVKITHWTEDDVQREESLRRRFKDVEPDLVIERFEQLSELFFE
jgi:phosphoglycolate phosphatase